jgi:hypothetical protein
MFNKSFLEALAKDFQEGGAQAIEKVRETQPAAYLKICALLVPGEMKVEHQSGAEALSDEQLAEAIAALRDMLARRAGEGQAHREQGAGAPRTFVRLNCKFMVLGCIPSVQRGLCNFILFTVADRT